MNTRINSATESQFQAAEQQPLPADLETPPMGAIIYCEANFGAMDGKTANGLVRSSSRFQIRAIIDSTHVGEDAGQLLDGRPNGIPICRNLNHALSSSHPGITHFIFGMAPRNGQFSVRERYIIFQAMEKGLHIVNGLHEFLSDDADMLRKAESCGVTISDIRKPAPHHQLNMFRGDVMQLACPRIAVLGTDTAVGKRTTATLLVDALRSRGVNAVMIATGQTGLMQGTPYGVAIDAIPAQFAAGELEQAILHAEHEQQPDIMIIEGQGALSHPAYSSSSLIVRGSAPDAVILQHAPGRTHRGDFPLLPMPDTAHEVALIQLFAGCDVIALTLNPENLTLQQQSDATARLRDEFALPVADVMTDGTDSIINHIFERFPSLNSTLKRRHN